MNTVRHYPNFLFRYCKQKVPTSTTLRPTTTFKTECVAPGEPHRYVTATCPPGEICILGRCKPGCSTVEPCPIGMECEVWVYKKCHYKKQ